MSGDIKDMDIKQRDRSMDLYKAILVIGMITGHIVQFFPWEGITYPYAEYINLTTYSGFLFVFGYVCYKAYFGREVPVKTLAVKMGRSFVKTLIAFYISGLAYTVLIEWNLDWRIWLDVILLRRIPGYSEFLLSFAFLYPVMLVFTPLIRRANGVVLMIFAIASLAMTYIDYSSITSPLLGVFVGTCSYLALPIVQYLSLFFAGIYLARSGKVLDIKILIASVAGTAAFLWYLLTHDELPMRFPPAIWCVTVSYLIVYIYYLICKKVDADRIAYHITDIGENTIVYLLISNITIFYIRRVQAIMDVQLTGLPLIVFYVIMMGLCMSLSRFTIVIIRTLQHER